MVGHPLNLDMWKSFYHSEIGRSHQKQTPPIPCQDASLAKSESIPYLIVCDGAGSAPLSHIGSKKIIETISELIELLEDIITDILEEESTQEMEEKKSKQLKKIFIQSCLQNMKKLSDKFQVPTDFFRSTLMIFLVGKKRSFWLKIGDGAILIQNTKDELEMIGPIQKGEFINETVFLSERIKEEEIAHGFLTKEFKAVISFTDGAGEKLMSSDGKKFAKRISDWFGKIRENQFPKSDLKNFLTDETVWSKTTGDDKSIAMLVNCPVVDSPVK
jgi:hypothetical protein